MSDIQKARDVLAKWRKAATRGEWRLGDSYSEYADIIQDTATMSLVASYVTRENMRFIVGTAGNSGFLDAIDGILDASASSTELSTFDICGKRIAAAIIAADERMSA